MRLLTSTTSPFGRLAHAMLIEAGAAFEIERLNPWADPEPLVALNPARRVPTFELDDGTVLTEAMVIAMHAADIAPEGSHLKERLAPERLGVAGRAFGMIEAAVYVMAGRKITSDDLAATASDACPVAERRRRAMREGLRRLDAMTGLLRDDRLGLPEILVMDAVQCMDFRFPGAEWRPSIPSNRRMVHARDAARPGSRWRRSRWRSGGSAQPRGLAVGLERMRRLTVQRLSRSIMRKRVCRTEARQEARRGGEPRGDGKADGLDHGAHAKGSRVPSNGSSPPRRRSSVLGPPRRAPKVS